jgi:urease subunit alpha
VAKLTINAAIAVGIDDHVGSIAPGKLADLVIWPRASFGIKPWMVLKSGFVVWSAMGDGNGSMPLSEPIIQRKMWGALGTAPQQLGVVFASKLAMQAGIRAKLGLVKPMLQIKSVRGLRKSHMIRNHAMPHIEVDPQTFEVRADGLLLMCDPPRRVPLSRRYMLR